MTQTQPIRIATRKSPLALWQAHYVKDALIAAHPGLEVELVTMVTKGDIILDTPLAKVGGKGLFVKELEVAMLEGRADLAVHSMKDVPVDFPEGLGLVTICEREDPRDAFVSNTYASISELPQGAIVGTCSLRRQCQLKEQRPDLVIKELRGNVGTVWVSSTTVSTMPLFSQPLALNALSLSHAFVALSNLKSLCQQLVKARLALSVVLMMSVLSNC